MNDFIRVGFLEYLDYTGRSVGKINSQGWAFLEGGEHDTVRVNVETDTFKWFAGNVGGGLFKFMIEIDGLSEAEAKATLKKIQAERPDNFEENYAPTHQEQEQIFHLSDHVLDYEAPHAYEYLTDIRGIDPKLAKSLIKAGFVTEEVKEFEYPDGKIGRSFNLWYLWRDKNRNIVGADTQATMPTKKRGSDKHQGYWKGVVQGSPSSKENFNFRIGSQDGVPDKIVVFEAPVDAISYWQLNFADLKGQNVQFIALSGVNVGAFESFVRDNFLNFETGEISVPREVHFALDNDEDGRQAARKMYNVYSNLSVFDTIDYYLDVPGDAATKDWNDQLRFGKTLDGMFSVEFELESAIPLVQTREEVEMTLSNINSQEFYSETMGQPEYEHAESAGVGF